MDLKIPSLPKVAIGWRKALTAVGVAALVVAVAFIGWTLFTVYTEERQVAAFGSHVAASEADLARVSGLVASHLGSRPDRLSVAGADASMREFAAIADHGRAVTAYHRGIIGADTVPEAYAGAQSAYIRALDHLNRAFSLWSSAATAYNANACTAAEENLARADQAWGEYALAVEDYDRELRAAEEGGEAPPV